MGLFVAAFDDMRCGQAVVVSLPVVAVWFAEAAPIEEVLVARFIRRQRTSRERLVAPQRSPETTPLAEDPGEEGDRPSTEGGVMPRCSSKDTFSSWRPARGSIRV